MPELLNDELRDAARGTGFDRICDGGFASFVANLIIGWKPLLRSTIG